MSETIFLVDDEQHIIDLVRLYLEREGFQVDSATDGQVALAQLLARPPDLVVLDLMLPGLDGTGDLPAVARPQRPAHSHAHRARRRH